MTHSLRSVSYSPSKRVALASIVALAVTTIPAGAQDAGSPDPETFNELYPGEAYSPYAQRSFPSHVYWGETHVHTGLSLDAGLFGNTLGPEDAYRLARGEEDRSTGWWSRTIRT